MRSPRIEPIIRSKTASEGSMWRYTGRQLDPETGLYYYRARYYNTALGRFNQTDPVGDKDSLNLYQYAMWDPVNYKDPSVMEVIYQTYIE